MSVIRLLRLHKGFGFQIRRVCVFGGFWLHELGYGITATGDLDHHPLIPQKTGGAGEVEGIVELESLAIMSGLQHGKVN